MFKKRRTKKPSTVNTSFPYLRQCLSVPIVSTGKVAPMTPYTLPDELTPFAYIDKIRDLSLDILSRLPILEGSYFSFHSRNNFGPKIIDNYPYLVVYHNSVVWYLNRAVAVRYSLDSRRPDNYDDAILDIEHLDYGNRRKYRTVDYQLLELDAIYGQVCDLHKEFIEYIKEKNED